MPRADEGITRSPRIVIELDRSLAETDAEYLRRNEKLATRLRKIIPAGGVTIRWKTATIDLTQATAMARGLLARSRRERSCQEEEEEAT